jgi:hypothetical protein
MWTFDRNPAELPDGTSASNWGLGKVLDMATIACRGPHAYEDCAGQCATKPQPFTNPKTGESGYQCQLADEVEIFNLEGEYEWSLINKTY